MTREERRAALTKLFRLIDDVEVCMMTTDDDGVLRSRPMLTRRIDGDDDLFFFTRADSAALDELGLDRRVNLSYADPASMTYVSVSGRASVERHRDRLRELWTSELESWLPAGLDDPDLVLLRVRIERAEHWNAEASAMREVIDVVRHLAGGRPPVREADQHGEHTSN